MIFGLFARRFSDETFALYRSIVAEARHPAFYLAHGVPDTVTARFDMIVLVLATVLHRLRAEPVAAEPRPKKAPPTPRDLAADLLDVFFEDMDRSLREMGIGDMGIPKRMKKLANAWNGRFQAYDAAFDEVDAAGLSAAVARNVLADADRAHADGLAAWTLACLAVLAATPVADVLAGRIPWPNPEPFAAAPATAPITPLVTGSPA
mgnify:CR=1 FL=1